MKRITAVLLLVATAALLGGWKWHSVPEARADDAPTCSETTAATTETTATETTTATATEPATATTEPTATTDAIVLSEEPPAEEMVPVPVVYVAATETYKELGPAPGDNTVDGWTWDEM